MEEKMIPLSLYACLTVIVIHTVQCERLKCQMIPFETTDGLMGHCCVFLKNISERSRGEIIDQITRNTEALKKIYEDRSYEDTYAADFPRASKNFNVEHTARENNRQPAKPTKKLGDRQNGESTDRVSDHNQNKSPKTSSKEGNQHNNSPSTNGTDSTRIVGFAVNRNAVDTPENCPEGTEKDHSGNCVQEF